jgi:hypothetical protein
VRAEALDAFAAEVRAGMAHATTAERRRICHLLKLSGRVYHNETEGLPIGPSAFVSDWHAVVALAYRTGQFSNTLLRTIG